MENVYYIPSWRLSKWFQTTFFNEVPFHQIRKQGSPPFPTLRCVKHD